MKIKLKKEIIQKELKNDKEYIVYFFISEQGKINFYLFDESPLDYLFPYSADLFDIVDNKLSQYWVFGTYLTSLKQENYIVSYPEMAKNYIRFYNNYVDGYETEVNIFNKYKKLIKHEYPDETIKELAHLLRDRWIQCPKCDNAWEEFSNSGMIICPMCKILMHNPHYKN